MSERYHPQALQSSGHLINGEWISSSDPSLPLLRHSPIDDSIVTYTGYEASAHHIQEAIEHGVQGQKTWQKTPYEKRAIILHKLGDVMQERKSEIAQVISIETGKPLWEATQEVDSSISKISHTIESYESMKDKTLITNVKKELLVRRKPLGLSAVFAPFNFPFHLPLGQIAPLLLSGNATLFKPSDLTPLSGQLLSECILEAFSSPTPVFQMVQGGKRVGEQIVENPAVRGIFFTGSAPVGTMIQKKSIDIPGRMVALEMGGNNPLVVSSYKDLSETVSLILISSYITAGQRCSAARRLIVVDTPENQALIDALVEGIKNLSWGSPLSLQPEPFMGPVVSPHAREKLVAHYTALIDQGAKPLVPIRSDLSFPSKCYMNPSLIDCTGIEIPDDEDFGPLLKLIRVPSLAEAIQVANQTQFGLSASLLSTSDKEFDLFFDEINAGIINWNSPTTGASSRAPFGGIGLSGNFRPGGYSMVESCCYPVTSTKDRSASFLNSLPKEVPLLHPKDEKTQKT